VGPGHPTNTEEEEENLFTKKAGCQKWLQPINAGYHTTGPPTKPFQPKE